MAMFMERCKVVGLIVVMLLAIGGIAAFPQASAQPSGADAHLQMADEGTYKKITTDDITIIFPRNGTKPFFVWWANNDTSKVYVVHFKGLVEYAVVNGSAFSLTNMAEGTLWQRLISSANALDLEKGNAVAKGLSVAFEANSKLILASTKAALFKADPAQVKAILLEAVEDLDELKNQAGDSNLTGQIDAAIDATNAAVQAIESGAGKGTVQNAISNAIKECQKLVQMMSMKVNAAIAQMVEQRERLKDLSQGFHPALLAFAGCSWELTEPQEIRLENGTSIGLAFNMTLTEAPHKFDFAEGKVKLAIRIYNSTVLETVEAGGEPFSYEVAAGEMKIDLIIENWDWNFDPKTVSLLNTSITVSPALALWVDASSFVINGSPEVLFDDLEGLEIPAVNGTMKFSADGTNATLNIKGYEQDAKDLGFKIKLIQRSVAGKLMNFPAPAKLRLTEEGTLGGFFKFVPKAVVTDPSGNESAVNVTAAYLTAGNHVKVYLCYPYFNGTLTHDPSLGVEKASEGAGYVVTLGADSGISSIKEIPATPAWGREYELFLASGLVLVAALGLILLVRRHPAAV